MEDERKQTIDEVSLTLKVLSKPIDHQPIVKGIAVTYLLAMWQPVLRWHESYLGSYTELGKLNIDARLSTERLPLKDSLDNQRENAQVENL
jgi:hypothetical protein